MRNFNNKYLVLVVSLFLLTACSDTEEKELNHYIQSVKSRALKPIDPLPTFEPIPEFAYPENIFRSDPFQSSITKMNNEEFEPNQNRTRQPLEKFPLDTLKFVGTLSQGNVIWGLIAQPDGLVTGIKKGEFIGQQYGKIVMINESSMKLEEVIKVQGKWKKRLIILNLNQEF